MARKNLLKGLMDEAQGKAPEIASEENPETEKAPPRTGRYTKGAIGAVSQSIADLKARSVIEIDPFKIRGGGLKDRLEFDEADHARLMESLRAYGQQVPVLVRPHPENPDEYVIVYGRRRVLALQDLKQPVKALVRDLDDAEAIMAQGQENSARRDLSFIEKANFARQMAEAGYDRKAIADALNTDKTLLSRLLSITETVPVEVIEMIGAAPGIGRDRWARFAQLWSQSGYEAADLQAFLSVLHPSDADDRFEQLLIRLEKKTGERPFTEPKKERRTAQKRDLLSGDGVRLGQMVARPKGVNIELSGKAAPGFGEWLADNLEGIHRDWLKKQRGE